MDDETRTKIEGLKKKAEFFLENDIRAFIKDFNDTFYFCDILLVGETHLMVQNFAGKRNFLKDRILWIDVKSIEEYEVKGE